MAGCRRIGQVEMIIVAKMKSKFIDEPGRDRGDHSELREMAGGPIGQRQTVPRRGGRIEVAVRAPEPLIVVGRVEGILVVEDHIDFAERNILIESA